MRVCFNADVARNENIHEVIEAPLLDTMFRRKFVDLDGVARVALTFVNEEVDKFGKVTSLLVRPVTSSRPFGRHL